MLPRSFRLSTIVICHELRCNWTIETRVDLLFRQSGETGYRYELVGVHVVTDKQVHQLLDAEKRGQCFQIVGRDCCD
jgi:hypothetical protein